MVPSFVHIIDYKNIGDAFCCPRELTPWSDAPVYNIKELPKGYSPVIIGGGGLLHPGIDKWIEEISLIRPCFIWGIGLNYHKSIPDNWPEILRHCKMVGLRDQTNLFEWVPCPSVLKVDWAKFSSIQPVHRIVTYAHYAEDIKLFGPLMRNINDKEIDDVFRFLASGETILTNTYHGVLWGTLLRRRIILWKPFSCRFFLMPFVVDVANDEDQVKWLLTGKRNVSNILNEFVKRAVEFRDKIIKAVTALL